MTFEPRKIRGPILETAVLLAITGVVNVLVAPEDPGLSRVSPHPVVVIALVMIARYGFFAGVCSSLFCAAAYSGALIAFADVPTLFHLTEAPYSTPLALLAPSTVIFGILVQKHLDRAELARAEAEKAARELEKAEKVQGVLRDANHELGRKVVGTRHTLTTLYRHARALHTDELQQIYEALPNLVLDVIGAEAASVWKKTDEGLGLAARAGSAEIISPQIDLEVARRLADKGIATFHEIGDGSPYMIGKIATPNGPLAYLTVDALPFKRYTPVNVELFRMAVEWGCHAVKVASLLRPIPGHSRQVVSAG